MKTVVILKLDYSRTPPLFEVNGPLDNPADRKIMIEMFEMAINVCKNYKGGTMIIADGARYVEMDKTKVNHSAIIKM